MTIRRAEPQDGPLLRELRLRALREDGHAFRSPLEREAAWLPERWSSWPERQAVFLAEEREAPVGMVAGFLDEERPGAARLVAMWVAPEGRGTGTARGLVEAVAAWAAAEGATTLMLDVLPGNAPARALYERAGFTRVATDGPLDTTCGADALTFSRGL